MIARHLVLDGVFSYFLATYLAQIAMWRWLLKQMYHIKIQDMYLPSVRTIPHGYDECMVPILLLKL